MKRNGIEKATLKDKVMYEDGVTKDIVTVVLQTAKSNIEQETFSFASNIERSYDGLNWLWSYVNSTIRYVEDPDGVQWIRRPARLAHDGEGDCKSFTLFIVSCLKNMGLDYTIRFASYNPNDKTVTHVYPIAYLPNGTEVIMDAVYDRFDEQKSYKYKRDYTMSQIAVLSGLGNSNASGSASVPDYAIHLERLNQTLPDDLLQNDVTTAFPDVFSPLDVSQFDSIEGIGNLRDKIKTLGKKIHAKVVNLIVKRLLPKYGTFFLFLFVQNPQTAEVKRRKAKQEKLASVIAAHLGVKYEDFLHIVALAIETKTGKNPAQVINSVMQAKVKGIGVIDPVSISLYIGVVKGIIEIFKKLKSLFGKNKDLDKGEEVQENDGADLNVLKEESHSVLTESEKAILNDKYGVKKDPSNDDADDASSNLPVPQGNNNQNIVPKSNNTVAPKDEKDNTLLYVAVGVGALFLLMQKKK
jgi:hypothetical protein